MPVHSDNPVGLFGIRILQNSDHPGHDSQMGTKEPNLSVFKLKPAGLNYN